VTIERTGISHPGDGAQRGAQKTSVNVFPVLCSCHLLCVTTRSQELDRFQKDWESTFTIQSLAQNHRIAAILGIGSASNVSDRRNCLFDGRPLSCLRFTIAQSCTNSDPRMLSPLLFVYVSAQRLTQSAA